EPVEEMATTVRPLETTTKVAEISSTTEADHETTPLQVDITTEIPSVRVDVTTTEKPEVTTTTEPEIKTSTIAPVDTSTTEAATSTTGSEEATTGYVAEHEEKPVEASSTILPDVVEEKTVTSEP